MGKKMAVWLAVCGLAAAAACNEPAFPTTQGSGPVIIIAHFAFTPASLAVPPGATIEVVNQDATPHSVTSESAPGAFVLGSVNGVSFDTGEFIAGVRTITIPADVPDGTVIPFFCTVHGAAMGPPDGNVTVSRAAAVK